MKKKQQFFYDYSLKYISSLYKVVSLKNPAIDLKTPIAPISEGKLLNASLVKKVDLPHLKDAEVKKTEPVKEKIDIVDETTSAGAKTGTAACIAMAILIGGVTATVTGLVTANPALFAFGLGATLGITALLILGGSFFGVFIGGGLGYGFGRFFKLVLGKRVKQDGPIIFNPPQPRQVAFVAGFSGVIAGAIQGGMVGSLGGPFGTFLGVFLGGIIGGIMGYLGGLAGAKLFRKVCNKHNERVRQEEKDKIEFKDKTEEEIAEIKKQRKLSARVTENQKNIIPVVSSAPIKTLDKPQALVQKPELATKPSLKIDKPNEKELFLKRAEEIKKKIKQNLDKEKNITSEK